MNTCYGWARILGAIMLLGSLAACASSADRPANNGLAEQSGSGGEADPNELICRREQVTGSNFPRRVCMTRAQRQEAAQSARELLRESSGRSGAGVAGPEQ